MSGQYRYPIVNSNFGAFPRVSRMRMRRGQTMGSVQASDTVLLDWFLPAAAVGGSVTGTAAVTQAAQTVALTGTETMSGSVAASAPAQSNALTGAETFSGTTAVTQQYQSSSLTGTETMTGTASVSQAFQTVSLTGAIVDIIGNVAATQAWQYISLVGDVTAPVVSAGAYQYTYRTHIPKVMRSKLNIRARRRV